MNTRIIRADGRRHDKLRNITIERGVNKYAEGSALIKWGDTIINCTATIENRVPHFMRGGGKGWITAEYNMLPRATQNRNDRDVKKGRSSEIQRVIGRSLRAAVYLGSIGERTIIFDCDVLQASAGTRTAAITASFVCLVDALRVIVSLDNLGLIPLAAQIAAVSVGLVNGDQLLDLSYEEDTIAEVDCNVVMTSEREFVELQGTGERRSFARDDLDCMLSLAWKGLESIFKIQRKALDLSKDEAELFNSFTSRECE